MRWIEALYFAIAILLFIVTALQHEENPGPLPYLETLPLFLVMAMIACVFWPFTALVVMLSEEDL